MYDKPPETFAELFAPFPEELQELGGEIRNRILAVFPEAAENVYGGKKVGNVLYSVGGETEVLCGMQPREKFVRVFFHNWQRLEKAGYKVEGSGKNARHIKLGQKSELDDLDLKAMLEIVKQ